MFWCDQVCVFCFDEGLPHLLVTRFVGFVFTKLASYSSVTRFDWLNFCCCLFTTTCHMFQCDQVCLIWFCKGLPCDADHKLDYTVACCVTS